MTTLRVGIIGANAESGWARDGHVPAVQGLAGLEFVAVATNSQKTADASAKAFGLSAAYGSGMDLIRAGGIDLVTVATRVPDHRELVLAAIGAGMHVYSEWPLGRSVAEAEEMAAAARKAGCPRRDRVAVARQPGCPAGTGSARVRRARSGVEREHLLGDGRVRAGRAGAVRLPREIPRTSPTWSRSKVPTRSTWPSRSPAPSSDANALATAQYPDINADGERRQRVTFDHLLVQSRLAAGGTLSAEVAGGRPPETPFTMTVVGEKGTLRLDGGAPRGFQSGRLTLSIDGEAQRVDEGELAAMPDTAANVAGVYAGLRDDIANGTSTVTGFDHAMRLTQLMNDLLTSSTSGMRVTSLNWPER